MLSDDYAFAGILIKFIKSTVRDSDNFIYMALKGESRIVKIYAGSVQIKQNYAAEMLINSNQFSWKF